MKICDLCSESVANLRPGDTAEKNLQARLVKVYSAIEFFWILLFKNERNIEVIVKNHFNIFLDIIEIEEQKSDNPKIAQLLKKASKKGIGAGFPDFIITYQTNSDLLIVIECKAEITKHESQNKDQGCPLLPICRWWGFTLFLLFV